MAGSLTNDGWLELQVLLVRGNNRTTPGNLRHPLHSDAEQSNCHITDLCTNELWIHVLAGGSKGHLLSNDTLFCVVHLSADAFLALLNPIFTNLWQSFSGIDTLEAPPSVSLPA